MTIKILVFSTLYPNAAQPRHGIFVETRLRQLLKTGRVDARVIAPVPWFPFASKRFGKYAQFSQVPQREQRFDIAVEHPRYPVIPKYGMTLAPSLLFHSAARAIRRLQRKGYDFDVIDAHYFYPDGVAAVRLGELFNKPVVITARGSDLNLLPQYAEPRRLIIDAATKAAANVTVSDALRNVMVNELGIASHKVMVMRNGVDLDVFRPVERDLMRERLAFKGPTILSVGNLVELKGHDLVIQALKDLPGLNLVIIGEGEMAASLRQQALSLGLAERVSFVDNLPQDKLREYYGAADALVLASSREGWPNVLLEAMACGTPVIATNVGGAGEIVTAPAAGLLVDERSPQAIAASLRSLLNNPPDRERTRVYAKGFGWEQTTSGLLKLFAQLVSPDDVINEGTPRGRLPYSRQAR